MKQLTRKHNRVILLVQETLGKYFGFGFGEFTKPSSTIFASSILFLLETIYGPSPKYKTNGGITVYTGMSQKDFSQHYIVILLFQYFYGLGPYL